jgi:hypothetical protein
MLSGQEVVTFQSMAFRKMQTVSRLIAYLFYIIIRVMQVPVLVLSPLISAYMEGLLHFLHAALTLLVDWFQHAHELLEVVPASVLSCNTSTRVRLGSEPVENV